MIHIRAGELAEVDAQAVVRAVDADGSSVTPAMRRLDAAAGPEPEAQCQRLGELPVGSAMITPAGELRAQFMVHVALQSREEEVTAGAVKQGLRNALRRLDEWGIASVAMPLLGTGAGNLDADEAAEAMLPILLEDAAAAASARDLIIVVDNEYELQAAENALQRLDPQALPRLDL